LHSGSRFQTLHKRRKKKPPTRALQSENALLDDLYNGPTKVNSFEQFETHFSFIFVPDAAGTDQPMAVQRFRLGQGDWR
jgi:hypothetical protein